MGVAQHRLEYYGKNELKEGKRNPVLLFLSYFWGPMPIMIWIAIIVEIIKASLIGRGWEDVGVLLGLQFLNGIVGFVEEYNAGNAIEALKEKLKPQAAVIRHESDGTLRDETIPATDVVPGDIVRLKIGDVIPADCVLLGDPDDVYCQLQVDESAITGESLPVTIHAHESLKMSSLVKQGSQKAVVIATGTDTFFGRAAELMSGEQEEGRFQRVLFRIMMALLSVSLVLTVVIFVVLVVAFQDSAGGESPILRALSLSIVILIASIPVAMIVVSTSTLALGSHALAAKEVIVARLGSIEELAGMRVLCCDKTGTLTKNSLTVGEPHCFGSMEGEEILFMAALTVNRREEDRDAIDQCIAGSLPSEGQFTEEALEDYELLDFRPFDPESKRATATVRGSDGRTFKVTKGAPQRVLRLALDNPNSPESLGQDVDTAIQELADHGYRSLGVAVSRTGQDEQEAWEFEAVVALYDPPREDTADTIRKALDNSVEVKMVTGDQRAIAMEVCRQLSMGTRVIGADELEGQGRFSKAEIQRISRANGFAEVTPEHKYNIVHALKDQGMVVGMTGDGVNDAPALKHADIGIAVEGATDAAQAAADIVLTQPGLSVIIDALLESRKIFQRMRNYAIYRIGGTIQLLLFFFIAIIALRPDTFFGSTKPDSGVCTEKDEYFAHETAFSIPVIAIVFITLLNDATVITIARDVVVPANEPQEWDLIQVFIISAVLGAIACFNSLLLVVFALDANCTNAGSFFGVVMGSPTREFVTYGEIQAITYLKISITDFLTVFSARTRQFFWVRRPALLLLGSLIVATGTSTLLASYWPFSAEGANEAAGMAPLKNVPYAIATIWIWSIVWFIIQDACKVLTYYILQHWRTEHREHMRNVRHGAAMSKHETREGRRQRTRGGLHRAASMTSSVGGSIVEMPSIQREVSEGSRSRVEALERRVGGMERELHDIQRTLQEILAGGAIGGLRVARASRDEEGGNGGEEESAAPPPGGSEPDIPPPVAAAAESSPSP